MPRASSRSPRPAPAPSRSASTLSACRAAHSEAVTWSIGASPRGTRERCRNACPRSRFPVALAPAFPARIAASNSTTSAQSSGGAYRGSSPLRIPVEWAAKAARFRGIRQSQTGETADAVGAQPADLDKRVPDAHVFDVRVLRAVELVGGDTDPLLDEHPLRNPLRIRVTKEFGDFPFNRLDPIFPGASLHFTRKGWEGHEAQSCVPLVRGQFIGWLSLLLGKWLTATSGVTLGRLA